MLLTKLFYDQETDENLILLVQQSDVKAFEELYKRYWVALVNAAYKRLNVREQAEDIVQNIFADLYKRRLDLELTGSLKAYLYTAVKFKVLNEYRSIIIRTRFHRSVFFSSNCKIDFSNFLEAKELQEKINYVLDGLPEKCKKVFLLSRKGSLSNKEISTKLNITVSTVEKHISKALKCLKCQI